MTMLEPRAVYTSPSEDTPIVFTAGDSLHTTDGKTTQISDIVIKAGGHDRDKPSPAKDTNLGALRARLTTVQDQVNEFLTLKMLNKRKIDEVADNDLERRILDDGVDEDSD